MIEQTITIGNIIEIVVIAAGGLSVFATMRATVKSLKSDVDGIQVEIKKLGDVLITQADQNRRILHMEEEIRELRHGHGFVRSGPSGIDREYP